MIEVLRSYIQDATGLLQAAGLLVAGAVVLATWTKTRSMPATLGSMLIGALLLGYLYNADFFGQKVGQDIQTRMNGQAPAAVVVEAGV